MNFLGIISQYSLPAVFAFSLMVVLAALALRLFPKWKMMDRPKKYGLDRAPIPYYGGVLILIVFVVAVLLFAPLDRGLVGVLIGGGVISVVGLLDDKFGLHPLIRLIAQFLAGVILVYSGIGILSINLPFVGTLDFTGIVFKGVLVLSALFTIFWVMAILNVMNFIDGVGGLSSGVGFIAAVTIFLLSVNPTLHSDPKSQMEVAMIAVILAGLCLGFLIFDFPKPKILMGDSGSTLLGFVIATLAIFSGGKVATAFLVLGIPILDMVWVVLRRFWTGQKIWRGDLKHLHHRLLDIGISERKVVTIYLAVTAFLGLSAVSFVSSQQKFFMIIALVVLMVMLAGALILIPKKK